MTVQPRVGTLALVLFAVLLSCPSIAAQESEGRVVVTVQNVDGHVVESAIVRSDTVSALTGADGTAVLKLSSGSANITVQRIGFVAGDAVVEILPGGDTHVTVVLQAAAVRVLRGPRRIPSQERLRAGDHIRGRFSEYEPWRGRARGLPRLPSHQTERLRLWGPPHQRNHQE